MRIILMTVNSLTVKQKSLKDETWTENRAVIGPSRLKSPTIDLASSGQNLSAATALSHLLEPSCSIILLHCGQRHDYSSTRLALPSVQPCSYRPPLPFSSRCGPSLRETTVQLREDTESSYYARSRSAGDERGQQHTAGRHRHVRQEDAQHRLRSHVLHVYH